jgi:hypothetical protein
MLLFLPISPISSSPYQSTPAATVTYSQRNSDQQSDDEEKKQEENEEIYVEICDIHSANSCLCSAADL